MTDSRPYPNTRFSLQALLLLCALIGCLPADPNVASNTDTPAPVEEIAETLQTSDTFVVPITFAEAPMLAQRVRQGHLPPLEERFPDSPLVS